MMLPIKVLTEMKPEHRNFILKSTMNSYRMSPFAKAIPADFFYPGEAKLILKLLQHCDFRIAVNPSDEYQIYAFMLFNKTNGVPLLHFVFTKKVFRQMGIANNLLREFKEFDKIMHTYYTRDFDFVLKKYRKIYNPYIRLEL
jgi:hypothetical protein